MCINTMFRQTGSTSVPTSDSGEDCFSMKEETFEVHHGPQTDVFWHTNGNLRGIFLLGVAQQ